MEQNKFLNELDVYFNVQSDIRNNDFWEDSKLHAHKGWEKVRNMSGKIIKILKMDNLKLEFERKEELSQSGKLISQITRTKLVRK